MRHTLQVRLAGDRYVLVEYGPMELDLNLRVRVWALQARLAAAQVRCMHKAMPCLLPSTNDTTKCLCFCAQGENKLNIFTWPKPYASLPAVS